MHDLVIENAVVVDGLGGPARQGGVAVTGGRVAAVGPDLDTARARVDAQGLTLAPGIVDIHTHYDAQLTWDRFATPSTAPTGAARLDTPAVGLHGLWVNGVRTVDERGLVRDCGRPGRVLRDFAA